MSLKSCAVVCCVFTMPFPFFPYRRTMMIFNGLLPFGAKVTMKENSLTRFMG